MPWRRPYVKENSTFVLVWQGGAARDQFGHNCGATPATDLDLNEYDAENRLVSRTDPQTGLTTNYYYNGQGDLVKKTQGSASTVYVAGLYEKNLSSGEVTKYYSFNGGRVAVRKGGTLRYLLGDHLGSTSTVLDTNGVSVGTQKYYPFGRTRSVNGTMVTDKLFTGYQEEGELYFAQARFYDPTLGRFTQGDSIVPDPGDPQALNRYAYTVNNPLRYVDPTGQYHSGTNTCVLHMGCDDSGGIRCNYYGCRNDVMAHRRALPAVRAMLNAGCTFHPGHYHCPTAGGGGNTQSAAERQRMRQNELRAAGMRAARAYMDATPRATPRPPGAPAPRAAVTLTRFSGLLAS